MKRNYNEITEELKSKYNLNKVYSYSQVKLYEEDPYEYFLKYLNYSLVIGIINLSFNERLDISFNFSISSLVILYVKAIVSNVSFSLTKWIW